MYSWFAPVQMARTLTCMHVETVFPGLEELTMTILQTIYLRTFLMSQLHSVTQTMWILIYYMPYFFNFWSNITMRYCVDGGHFGFLAVENFTRGWQSLGTQNGKLHVISYHYVVKISLYPISSGFTNSAPGLVLLVRGKY